MRGVSSALFKRVCVDCVLLCCFPEEDSDFLKRHCLLVWFAHTFFRYVFLTGYVRLFGLGLVVYDYNFTLQGRFALNYYYSRQLLRYLPFLPRTSKFLTFSRLELFLSGLPNTDQCGLETDNHFGDSLTERAWTGEKNTVSNAERH